LVLDDRDSREQRRAQPKRQDGSCRGRKGDPAICENSVDFRNDDAKKSEIMGGSRTPCPRVASHEQETRPFKSSWREQFAQNGIGFAAINRRDFEEIFDRLIR
jgi:hypothetical protein